MGYDRGDSFPFDFEPNGNPFGSENRKENCHHDHIPFNVKGNANIVFSVRGRGREMPAPEWQGLCSLAMRKWNFIDCLKKRKEQGW